MKRSLTLFLLVCLMTGPQFLNAQEGYQPSQENLENREWFQDAKFGLFVHWGVYSLMAGGGDMGIAEWIMHRKEIPIEQYELLPGNFYPVKFDPAEWVSLVKEAGMNYITITSKHHDGFAMYDSEISDYNIVDATPYGKDVIGMLKEECDRQGVKLFFYYSQLDWHHPDYYPRGNTGTHSGRPDHGEWDHYIDYMNAQLSELLTNYGEIGGIWFDGMWDKWEAPWRLAETYSLIHELQPGTLIGSNHHKMPYPGEDFQMFERDLPGQNTIGFNQTGISDLPLEMCETMNGSWGFNIKDTAFKSTEYLLHLLIRAAGKNANMLLNTGPMPNGEIQPANVQTLKEMGTWMNKYGETIYGTRGGPVEGDWGTTTVKGDHVYVHLLDPSVEQLTIPLQGGKVKSLTLFEDGSKVKFSKGDDHVTFAVPEHKKMTDFILVLEKK
ncbi:MAG: alpha-L-fucosidase [Bacteroidales bacterium]|nr:alpha-L-fucosidase [Bacteroidales bacterium]